MEVEKKEIEIKEERYHDEQEYFEDPTYDPERAVTTQEIIDVLEKKIKTIEESKGKSQISEIAKTVVLICKILAVELNRTIPEDSNHRYVV